MKRRSRITLMPVVGLRYLAFLLLAFATVARAPRVRDWQSRRQVARERNALKAALEAGNADGAAGRYARSADASSQSGAILRGAASIAAGLRETFAAYRFSAAQFVATYEVQHPSLVRERGTYEFVATDEGGRAMAYSGEFECVWCREGQHWRVSSESIRPRKTLRP